MQSDGLETAVDAVEGVHAGIIAAEPRLPSSVTVPRPTADTEMPEPRATTRYPPPSMRNLKTQTAVDHRAGSEALQRQLASRHERCIPVVGGLIGHTQRAEAETAEQRSTKLDHDDTFTALDGQRPTVRLRRGRDGPDADERRARAEDKDEHPHWPEPVSAHGVGPR